ncbi:hypothetical protein [Algicella marina]|uniref:Uncharacterized protein n=1 Tax=Algicella marina TaxID=2683284 RepID=A0A6P1SWN6_9RHOB|nr:hypothetical protein [Algicella marina]QHQ33753.1 hypothetical protein GO499_00440 [Algicella marina]
MTGIGHNKGPSLEPGAGWRRYAWKRARQSLMKEAVPLEIVRLRMRRAKELGLAYPQYASILRGTGRDVTAFLFTCDGLGLRLRRRLEMPQPVRDKLGGLIRTDLLALAPEGEVPEEFRAELEDVSGLRFAAAGVAAPTGWRASAEAVRSVLGPLKLAGDAVVLIGENEAAGLVVAGKLAGHLQREAYFGET